MKQSKSRLSNGHKLKNEHKYLLISFPFCWQHKSDTRQDFKGDIKKSPKKCSLVRHFLVLPIVGRDNKVPQQYGLVNHKLFDVLSTFTRILMSFNSSCCMVGVFHVYWRGFCLFENIPQFRGNDIFIMFVLIHVENFF